MFSPCKNQPTMFGWGFGNKTQEPSVFTKKMGLLRSISMSSNWATTNKLTS